MHFAQRELSKRETDNIMSKIRAGIKTDQKMIEELKRSKENRKERVTHIASSVNKFKILTLRVILDKIVQRLIKICKRRRFRHTKICFFYIKFAI